MCLFFCFFTVNRCSCTASMTDLGHICVRPADYKQLMGLVEPQYTTYDKKCLISILQNVGPRQQSWVSWSAGALLITSMGDPIVILWMLAVLFSVTWMMTLATTTIRDQNIIYWLEKTINLHYTAILRATLHREVIGKEW